MAQKLNVLTVVGLAHWASYFVNGDESGLETSDKAQADEWFDTLLRENPLAESVDVMDVGEPYSARFNGLLSDVVEYTVHVRHKHDVQLPKVELGHANAILRALSIAASVMDVRVAETADKARMEDLPLTERARLENIAASDKRLAASFRDALAEVIEAMPLGRYRIGEVNGEGLTWEAWKTAARASDSSDYRLAWRRGEDPTEWIAR